ncbi:hypothetical protein RKD37_000511 [Streptomyces ambofaciens]
MQFPGDEADGGGDADGEAGQRHRGGPAAFGAFLEDEDEAGHGDGGDQRSGRVEPVGRGLAGVGDRLQGQGQGHEDQDHREDEQQTPVGDVDEEGGEEHAQDAAASGDPRPHADRLAALLLGEGGGDDGEGDRHDHRGSGTAGHPGGEHDLGRGGQSREDARGTEDSQPGDEHGLAAQSVADRAEREQQRGQGERVDVDDPQDRVLGGAELDGHVGLRDVQT